MIFPTFDRSSSNSSARNSTPRKRGPSSFEVFIPAQISQMKFDKSPHAVDTLVTSPFESSGWLVGIDRSREFMQRRIPPVSQFRTKISRARRQTLSGAPVFMTKRSSRAIALAVSHLPIPSPKRIIDRVDSSVAAITISSVSVTSQIGWDTIPKGLPEDFSATPAPAVIPGGQPVSEHVSSSERGRLRVGVLRNVSCV